MMMYYVTIQSASDTKFSARTYLRTIFDEKNEKLPDPTGSTRTMAYIVKLEDKTVFTTSHAIEVSYHGAGRKILISSENWTHGQESSREAFIASPRHVVAARGERTNAEFVRWKLLESINVLPNCKTASKKVYIKFTYTVDNRPRFSLLFLVARLSLIKLHCNRNYPQPIWPFTSIIRSHYYTRVHRTQNLQLL